MNLKNIVLNQDKIKNVVLQPGKTDTSISGARFGELVQKNFPGFKPNMTKPDPSADFQNGTYGF